jgi:hypothetical protein
VLQFQQPVIGDGHAVRVTPEIVEHLAWPTEGRFGIYHPLLMTQTMNETLEGERVIELRQ